MINSICKFNLFLGTFFNTSVFLDLDIFSHFGKYQQQTIAADEPEWWLKFFLLKFQTLIIIVTTNVTVCALRNGVWYSSFFVLIPQLFLYDGANIRNIICWFF